MKHQQALGLILLTAASVTPLAFATPGSSTARGAEDPLERTGVVDAWHVLANGTVSIRLTGRAKDQAFTTWFTTPGDKTEATRFEHQLLTTVLSFAASRQELTVGYAAKTEKTDKLGRTIKDAIPIEAIMWNVLPSEEKDKEKKPLTASRKSN